MNGSEVMVLNSTGAVLIISILDKGKGNAFFKVSRGSSSVGDDFGDSSFA